MRKNLLLIVSLLPHSCCRFSSISFILLTILAVFTISCLRPQQFAQVKLQGAGARFPKPIYQKWFEEYGKSNPGVVFDYQEVGSGGAIKQIIERWIDFGGTDAPMKDEDLAKAPGPILHIPSWSFRNS